MLARGAAKTATPHRVGFAYEGWAAVVRLRGPEELRLMMMRQLAAPGASRLGPNWGRCSTN